jgi:hypothetical protein
MNSAAALPDLSAIRIDVSEAMMTKAWILYDRDGAPVGSGIMGIGALEHGGAGIPARATVGRDVWSALRAAANPSPALPHE